MKIRNLHGWDVTAEQARLLQDDLAKQVQLARIPYQPKLIAGIDCAFLKDDGKIVACVVVLEFKDMKIVESAHAVCDLTFPYVPGLLSFREAPACLAAVEKLSHPPDLFLIDGQGIAHYRRLGLASHLGLFLDKPTIGCAKSRLIGVYY